MADLKIEYVKLSEIKPYKGNAKTHPKEQIEQIFYHRQGVGLCGISRTQEILLMQN